MRRWYQAIAVAAIAFVAAGGMLAITAERSMLLRAGIGRGFVAVSLIGLMLCALLRTKAEKAAESTGFASTVESNECKCTFSDVAANSEALRSLEQLREYIVNPQKYASFGARMPKGVLLYGPPGTGKTLLARALAGEANVPFFALSGSDFVEKYVGVGAMRVRELFKKARKAGKCVIFIDEIDAMGKKRTDHSSDERDQTLNALLSEMSGFRSGEGIIVIAATNRLEMLDPALLRPGRFDRQIEVALPGKRERLSILQLHCRNKPLAADVNLESIAAQTAYFSGASLENLLNEASILAANDSGNTITMEHLRKAAIRTIVGDDRPGFASEAERKIIALHEAGHAVAAHVLTPESRLSRVSILPAGRGAAGYNLIAPPERVMLSKRDLKNQIRVLLAGRAAEMLIGGEEALTAGASNDLERATEIASAMALELGMIGEPAVSMKALLRNGVGVSNVSERVRGILGELFAQTQQILADNIAMLDRLSDSLLRHETLDEMELDSLFRELSIERQPSTNTDVF